MNDDAPATRGELKAMGAELRQTIDQASNHVVETLGARMDRMRGELTTDFDGRMLRMREELSTDFDGRTLRMHEELSTDFDRRTLRMYEELSTDFDRGLVRMREDLSRELAGHVRAAAEENRQFLAVLDDRYRDLPPRVTLLERELDEHRRDATQHPRRRRK